MAGVGFGLVAWLVVGLDSNGLKADEVKQGETDPLTAMGMALPTTMQCKNLEGGCIFPAWANKSTSPQPRANLGLTAPAHPGLQRSNRPIECEAGKMIGSRGAWSCSCPGAWGNGGRDVCRFAGFLRANGNSRWCKDKKKPGVSKHLNFLGQNVKNGILCRNTFS